MFKMVFSSSSGALLCMTFLLLGLFHHSFSELSSSCSVEEVKAERKASLTCMFSVDLQETKYQIIVKHFKSESASTPDDILQCIHNGNEYVCPYKADNTTFDGNINRNLTIGLPAGKAYEGSYQCDIIPNTPVSSNMFKPCSFQLSKETEDEGGDSEDKTGMIIGLILGILGFIVVGVLAWIIVKKKKSQAKLLDDKVDMEPLQQGPIYKGNQTATPLPVVIQPLVSVQDERDPLLQGKGDGKDNLQTDVGPEDSEDKKKLGEESPKQEGYDSGQPGAGDRVKLRDGQSVLENPAVAEQLHDTDQDVHSRGNPVA